MTIVLHIGAARAQVIGDTCEALKSKHDEYIKTADGMVLQLISKAASVGKSSDLLGQLAWIYRTSRRSRRHRRVLSPRYRRQPRMPS
jgi:hypothetical protein